MDGIAKAFLDKVDSHLEWTQLRSRQQYIRETGPNHLTLSLMDWTAEVFLRTTTETYWGKSVWKSGPDIPTSFFRWEATTWKYVYQLPRFLSRDMHTAKDQLIEAFTQYFALPTSDRADKSFFVELAEEELRDIGFGDNDIAKCHMLQHCAYVGFLLQSSLHDSA